MENVEYFNGIEKVLSSIGLYISDALITFFNSDGIENKDVCMIILNSIIIFIYSKDYRSMWRYTYTKRNA
jgi:hypothetical protein